MRSILLFILLFFTCSVMAQSPAPGKPAKEKHSSFGKKQKKESAKRVKNPTQRNGPNASIRKKKNKTGDGFTAHAKTKDYGERSKGKRSRGGKKQKISTHSANDAFSANKQTKNYGERSAGKRSKKVKNTIKGSSLNDAFAANKQTKNYGERASGKRVRPGKRRIDKGKAGNDGGFTVSNKYTMDYGDKATGKKVKKKTERKLQRSKTGGHDAFASRANMGKYKASGGKKGKTKNPKVGTGKKRKKFRLFRFKSREERDLERSKGDETGTFNSSRKERKNMKRQKKKKMYGLGLPQR